MNRRTVPERTLSVLSPVVRTLCVILPAAWGLCGSTAISQEPPVANERLVVPATPPTLDWNVPLPVDALGKQVYPARIRTWLAAYTAWLTKVCQLDEDQRRRLEQAVIEHSASPLVDETARSIWTKHGRQTFSMSQLFHVPAKSLYPAWFADERASVAVQVRNSLDEWLRRELLSPMQAQLLSDAASERTRMRRAAFRDLLIQQLHPDLSLTENQWTGLRQKWDLNNDEFDTSLFDLDGSKHTRESSLRVRPRIPARFITLTRAVLSETQRLYLKEASAPERTNWNLVFTPLNAESTARLEELGREYGSHLQRLAELRIQEWTADAGLEEQAASDLRTAAAEASRIAGQSWAKGRIRTIRGPDPERVYPSSVNLSPLVFGPSILSWRGLWPLDQEPIWVGAVERAFGRHPFLSPAETARARAVLVEAVLTSLDQELWLAPDQQTRLRPLIDAALPEDIWDHELWSGPHREIIWCAYPLLKIPAEQRRELLSPPQQRAWVAMAAMFIRMRDVIKFKERALNVPEGFADDPAVAKLWVIRDDETGVGLELLSNFELK